MPNEFHGSTSVPRASRGWARIAGAAAVLGVAATLQAHHSIAGVFDFGQRLTLDATVVQFEFVNPHPFISVDVAGEPAERWRLDMDNPTL